MKFTQPLPTVTDHVRRFCISCQTETVTMIGSTPPYTWSCSRCNTVCDRVLSFGMNTILSKSSDDTLWHESVAVFVFNDDRKILCFERTEYPIGKLTIPAGHAENDKSLEASALMELEEEVGIADVALSLIDSEPLHESCGWGIDDHLWHVYRTSVPSSTTVVLNDEGVNPMWLTAEEILLRNPVFGLEHFTRKHLDLFH